MLTNERTIPVNGMTPEDGNWRKSSRSVGGGACLEAANGPAAVLIRDSTDRTGPVLVLGLGAWKAFTAALRAGAA